MAAAGKANGTATDSAKILEKIPPVANPLAKEPAEIASNINYHAQYSPHFSPFKFEPEQAFYATAESIRDQLIKQWNDTYSHYHKANPKQTYYLSMEYLQGRALTNAVGNLDVQDAYTNALKQLGYALEEIAEQEKDAALGNGGLGRLASCFLDSMATLNLPAWGYGLRYRYGLFKQLMTETGQEEIAEDWLEKFSPWEIPRHDVVFPVRFFGQVEVNPDGSRKWVGGEVLQAVAYDVPIPGYKTKNTNSLRLWEAKARADDFNLFQFNDGKYESAALLHSRAQQICAVLYPGDATEDGKLLRLKQQFFLCSASLQDIFARFKERIDGKEKIQWSEFPSKVAVQLNDTHPTLAIPELMRLLMDVEGLGWDEAWDITNRTVAYTNHTVLPEALEKWSQAVMWKLLPRHMEIIEEIDKRFIKMVKSTKPNLEGKIPELCILDNNPQKPVVRMANLCVVSAHTVNGVAQLHSDILKAELFVDYVSVWPTKFQNKTNGITPRRWLKFCNPELSQIITKWLKTDQWVNNLDLLVNLRQFADNSELQGEWESAKMASKQRLANYVHKVTGVSIDPTSLFDIQIKRIHEYKRQLMNILGTVYRYKKLKEMSPEERKKTTPRTIMVGGKAFATYTNAKRIVKLVSDVGAVVNTDPEVNSFLKVVFVPNYNVSVAEVLIPGSELSQHISTAGMEASGTSNMKFALNGCLIIGTLDGANVEIREEVGEENFFLFGAKADEVARLRKEREQGLFKPDPRFEEAKQFIRSGAFGSYDYNPLLDSLEGNSGFGRGDYFLVGYDFPSYMDAQARVDEAYKDRKKWTKMSILSTAGSGTKFEGSEMAAYAALLSLLNNIHAVTKHPHLSTSLDNKQIQPLLEKSNFLLDFIEGNTYGRGSKEVQDLERKIAAAAHAAEDLIESHIVDQIYFGKSGANLACSLDLQQSIHEMDAVMGKLMQILEKVGVKKEISTHLAVAEPLKQSGGSGMVGLDADLNQLLDELTDARSRLRVISIVGMGGIGKTTLAKKVYEHSLIKEYFNFCAWATVSQQNHVNEILSQLVYGVGESAGSGTIDDLKLCRTLEGRRYLIVLDDIWNVQAWDEVKRLFPDKDNGSRVLLTTRLSTVDRDWWRFSTYKMNLLDEENSWKLFCYKAFQNEPCPIELREVGEEIVRLCEGLPLYIVEVAGILLNSPRSVGIWEEVAENLKSIPNSNLKQISLDVLSSSYNHLPPHLKSCFLYMGVFKKDSEISVSRIIRLWLAEGFVKPIGSLDLEEIAENYINDLIDNNLIFVGVRRKNGKVRSCRIHPLLRDLAIKLAVQEEFLHRGKGKIQGTERRLVGDLYMGSTEVKLPLVRSIIIEQYTMQPTKHRLLRVLDEIGFGSKKDYWENVNLRYLHQWDTFNHLGELPT